MYIVHCVQDEFLLWQIYSVFLLASAVLGVFFFFLCFCVCVFFVNTALFSKYINFKYNRQRGVASTQQRHTPPRAHFRFSFTHIECIYRFPPSHQIVLSFLGIGTLSRISFSLGCFWKTKRRWRKNQKKKSRFADRFFPPSFHFVWSARCVSRYNDIEIISGGVHEKKKMMARHRA